MVRIFAGASIDGNLYRICVNDNGGARVNLFRLEEACFSRFATLRRARRTYLNERERFTSFVGRSYSTINLARVPLPFTSDPNGYTLLVARRFQIGHPFKGNSAIRNGMLSVLTPTMLICCLQGTLLSRAALSNGRCERINKHCLSDSVGNARRHFVITSGTRAWFCLLCFHFYRSAGLLLRCQISIYHCHRISHGVTYTTSLRIPLSRTNNCKARLLPRE